MHVRASSVRRSVVERVGPGFKELLAKNEQLMACVQTMLKQNGSYLYLCGSVYQNTCTVVNIDIVRGDLNDAHIFAYISWSEIFGIKTQLRTCSSKTFDLFGVKPH